MKRRVQKSETPMEINIHFANKKSYKRITPTLTESLIKIMMCRYFKISNVLWSTHMGRKVGPTKWCAHNMVVLTQ